MIWFRRLHKWIGLAIGIQVGIWMLSGLLMNSLDHEQVQGHHHRGVTAEKPLGRPSRGLLDASDILESLPPGERVSNITLQSYLDTTVYHVSMPDGVQLYDATSGQRIIVTEHDAAELARRDYSGPGKITSIAPLWAPTTEVRRHAGDVWRVDFDDDDATTLYASADDGTILERRNATWRLFDVFWMLHIMDYQDREDFNNGLVVLVSLIAAWFSITGAVLFLDSFRREDFLGLLPGGWWRTRARIAVCTPHGEVVARVDSYTRGRLYDELAKDDIVLPSNCGGGGTCGLCVVNLGPAWPESPADRRLLSACQRKQGTRLSCQATVADRMVVGISDHVLSAKIVTAEVTACRFVTPFIRELRLDIAGDSFDYPAGSYVHAIIPPHQIANSTLKATAEVRVACGAARVPQFSGSESEIRRAYSLATSCEDHPGTIVLNVRFLPPVEGGRDLPAGVGSTYMWSLEPGDCLDLVGPLGDFRAQESDRDMIFIGGGAGMAPLRAIIRSELIHKRRARRIDFWYGARSRSDLFYVAEFEDLHAANTNFCWQPVLSEPLPADTWQGPTGFVHDVVRQAIQVQDRQPYSCEFYICGPPLMLSATRRMLAELGVPEAQIMFDDFGI